MIKTYVCLYQHHVSDLPESINLAVNNCYDAIAFPIVNPLFQREFEYEPCKSRHLAFSRSDMVLKSAEWLHKVISVLSDYIDCDSPDEAVRRHSEKTLIQEMSFAEHLVQHGHMMIRLKAGRTINLARIISRNIKGTVLVSVPMVDPAYLKQTWRADVSEEEMEAGGEDTWLWWNKFRLAADFNIKIKLVLEMSEDIPSKEAMMRWLGEPVECVVVPSFLFIRNRNNYPVLSKSHQETIAQFVGNNTHFIVKASREDGSLRHYAEYMKHLVEKFKVADPMQGFDDLLEIPLQPLFDNLDSYTYEIFEKDPIKYRFYQDAIELALIDRVPDSEISNKTVIIMVVGAGRGPLVRAALNASANTGRKTKVYIIEKNPNAIITLTSLVNELWSAKDVQIISCDMRDFTPPEKADILVSELLGSFGDNELSPECLDGAQKHLKPDGISIPCRSTSYVNPVMSSKIYNMVRQVVVDRSTNPREKMQSYATQAENTYVVYMKNVYHIAEPQETFVFDHPNKQKVIDNSRYKTMKFKVSQDCILHGFAGYFDTVLYKDIVLSIHPQTHSVGLSSWFSMFFPITEPQNLKAGDELEANFWRCVSPQKVWYEWSTSHPYISHVHNHNGRACPIYK